MTQRTSQCIFRRPDGRFQCRNRGIIFSTHAQEPIHCICDSDPPSATIDITPIDAQEFDEDLASFGLSVKSDEHRVSLWLQWRTAIEKWKKAGKPRRSEAEVDYILEICRACDSYGIRLMLPYCKTCGCNLSTPGIDVLSKAKLRTEVCPKNKW